MTTESDMASAFEELERQVALKNQLSRANKKEAEPTGYCLNCGEQLAETEVIEKAIVEPSLLDGASRWCDADCRNDWEKSKK